MLGESLPVIPNVFHLTYIINRGAAFGMLANQRWFFLLVAVILLGACAYYWKRLSKGPWTLQIGSALLVSGAIGNGIDRYMLHGVVDFFDFRIWPIFNVDVYKRQSMNHSIHHIVNQFHWKHLVIVLVLKQFLVTQVKLLQLYLVMFLIQQDLWHLSMMMQKQ